MAKDNMLLYLVIGGLAVYFFLGQGAPAGDGGGTVDLCEVVEPSILYY